MNGNNLNRTYPAIYRGVVESNEDPKSLGRCKVRIPSIHGELKYPIDNLPWARPIASTPIGSGRGSALIPDVGDIVWVFFEGANKTFPVYLGGTYGEGDIELDSSRVDFYVEGDSRISYDRSNKSFIVSLGDKSIKIENAKISITGDTNIEGTLRIEGNLTVSGDLGVLGTTTLSSLNVLGSTTFHGSVSGIPKE